MKLYIKNMVCDRCTMAVRRELDKSKIAYSAIELGEVELTKDISERKLQKFSYQLSLLGFELIEDKKSPDHFQNKKLCD